MGLQEGQLFRRFDAFGDRLHAKGLGHLQNRAHHGRVGNIRSDIAYKCLVDLDDIDGHAFEITQRRIAAAEIIDGDFAAALPQPVEDFDILDVIGELEAFGDFDQDPVLACKFAVFEQAHDHLDMVADHELGC